MSVYITEFQDANGDVVYPHTDSRVVWRPNGNRLEDTMKAIESALNGATTTTDLPATNSSTILATSKAVNAVYSNL
ncbi:MAG: hypothetical protein Q4G60_10780, partial [bacterium]|nr:hypothetical protein [bacterium]